MNDPSRPWRDLPLPPELIRIPAMLSHEEKQYLSWLTAERFEGWGAIVDLGPWLGASSASLADGLRRTGRNATIHSLDLFLWEPSYMNAASCVDLQDGDDFLPLLQHEVGEYAPWIDARKADLRKFAWTAGPIEILFVDAAKNWEMSNAILRNFAAFLIPGRSRIVLQDFRYHDTHWLPLIFDSRPDIWQEVESVAEGWTVTFTALKRPLGPAGIHPDYSEASFPFESAERLLRQRMATESPRNRQLLLRTLYRKALIDGPREALGPLQAELLAAGLSGEEIAQMKGSAGD